MLCLSTIWFSNPVFGGTLDPKLPDGWTTHLKSMLIKLGIISPQIPGWKFQNIFEVATTYMGVSLNGGFPQQPWVFLLKMIILGCFGDITI